MNKHFCCGSYEQHGKDIGSLVDQKQAAYGDSFHRASEVMQILYPDGIRVDQYQDVLTMIRVIDKLFRIATKKDAFGESPWKDVAGYGLLASKDTEPVFPGAIDYGQGAM